MDDEIDNVFHMNDNNFDIALYEEKFETPEWEFRT